MKRREQALRLLEKAAQDEALVDEVLLSPSVSDEIVGFHCQQAAEKMLKAALSDLGVPYGKTHDLGGLMTLLSHQGRPLPTDLSDLDTLTPFGTVYRYEDLEPAESFDRPRGRSQLTKLRAWVESLLSSRPPAN